MLCYNYDPYLSHTAPVTRSYHSTRITRVTHFILNPIPCRYVSVHEQLVMFPPLVRLPCHEALSCCSREVSSIRKGLLDHNLLNHFLITRFAYCTLVLVITRSFPDNRQLNLDRFTTLFTVATSLINLPQAILRIL